MTVVPVVVLTSLDPERYRDRSSPPRRARREAVSLPSLYVPGVREGGYPGSWEYRGCGPAWRWPHELRAFGRLPILSTTIGGGRRSLELLSLWRGLGARPPPAAGDGPRTTFLQQGNVASW